MDSPEELARLAQGLEQMRTRLLDLMYETADAEVRQQMQVAADRIQDGAIPFVQEYSQLKADVERRMAEVKHSAEETIAKAEEAKQKIAEAQELAMQPPPPPAETPIDPAFGGRLRDEILELFAPRAEPAANVSSGSLWSALRHPDH